MIPQNTETRREIFLKENTQERQTQDTKIVALDGAAIKRHSDKKPQPLRRLYDALQPRKTRDVPP